jgi:hypothetical protein
MHDGWAVDHTEPSGGVELIEMHDVDIRRQDAKALGEGASAQHAAGVGHSTQPRARARVQGDGDHLAVQVRRRAQSPLVEIRRQAPHLHTMGSEAAHQGHGAAPGGAAFWVGWMGHHDEDAHVPEL